MVPTRRLRIALSADPELPVPPRHYGGIERIIDMLVRGLVERDHDVTLFAHRDSEVPCRLEPYPGLSSKSMQRELSNLRLVSSKIRKGHYDIVHSFGRLAYLLPILSSPVPKLMSYQRAITGRSVSWGERLSRGTLHFSGCSHDLIKRFSGRPNWHVVYNGVPLSTYTFQEWVEADAPLVFLGRVEEIKGPHLAIEVSQRTNRKLIIAGNVPDERKHRDFFESRIAPYIDGELVQYLGPVDDNQKNDLLGRAAALLMPILWDEPFGIVMAEALACGTPVIALRRGSAPEIVKHAINGFVCDSAEDMASAVSGLEAVDRGECRRIVVDRFSDRAVVDAYESLYFRIIAALNGERQVVRTWQESV